MKKMKWIKKICIVLSFVLALGLLSSCAGSSDSSAASSDSGTTSVAETTQSSDGEPLSDTTSERIKGSVTKNDDGTQTVEDASGRTVTIDGDITKIAPSGATTTMFLLTLAPEMLVGLSASPSTKQMPYFPEYVIDLPTFGQFYGAKSTLNMESLISADPQVIFDIGDRKVSVVSDMDSIQNQTGIPTLFFEATLEEMPNAYRKLGQILGKEDEAEELAQFVEKTVEMAKEKSAQIKDEDKVRILFGTGTTGLAVNASGSSQSQVIDLIGAKNAVIPDIITDSGGGTQVSLEEVYGNEPDVIILMAGGPYDELSTNEWSDLKAVKEGKYYEIPNLPYCWMSSPPSVNMVLGVWWLGQLVYPDVYNDYDIVEVAKEYYKLFWHYDLSDEEAEEMLSKSYFKEDSASTKETTKADK